MQDINDSDIDRVYLGDRSDRQLSQNAFQSIQYCGLYSQDRAFSCYGGAEGKLSSGK